MFSGVPDSTVLHATSPEVIFSCKSKMAAAKTEVLFSQRKYFFFSTRDELETIFQRLYMPMFSEVLDSIIVLHTTSPEVVFSCKSKTVSYTHLTLPTIYSV